MMEYDELKQNIDVELWAIQQYLDSIQLNKSHLINLERERYLTTAKLFSIDNKKEESIKMAEAEGELLEKYVIPRYLGSSFIVILWSVFEDEMTQIAKYVEYWLQTESPRIISLSEIKGEFLDRLMKFFEATVVFLSANEEELRQLELLYAIRNLIVHENSRVTGKTDKKILRAINSNIGVSIKNNRIVVEEKYCRSMYGLAGNVITGQLEKSFDQCAILENNNKEIFKNLESKHKK